MTQLAAQASQQNAQRPVAEQTAEQGAAQQARHHGLAHVEENDAQRVFRAVGAVEVGQPRVAAAVLPHVVVDDEVADHHRAVKTAQKITQEQKDQPRQQIYGQKLFQFSSSPFWRIVSTMGVPSKPNTLRSWFSRYRW